MCEPRLIIHRFASCFRVNSRHESHTIRGKMEQGEVELGFGLLAWLMADQRCHLRRKEKIDCCLDASVVARRYGSPSHR